MLLHKAVEVFGDIVAATANDLGLLEFQIEKDYYVSLYLKVLTSLDKEGIVFKGGTSLSKCYDVIHRFSEDMDLALQFNHSFVGDKKRKRLKKTIVKASQLLEATILNLDQIESNKDYNFYEIAYNNHFEGDLKTRAHILIETIVVYKPYPTKSLKVSNYITKYLEKINRLDLIKEYQLEPFMMQVQTIERTLIDKLYALVDYHLQGKYNRNSRHLYDVHMIWNSGLIDAQLLQSIILDVTKDRQIHGIHNVSCQPNQNPNVILKEIVVMGVYKNDFNTITSSFIFDSVTYETCIATLNEIQIKAILPELVPTFL